MKEQLLSLEHEREMLLANYGAEELSYFNKLIQEAESHFTDEVVTCLVSTKEDGSNG